MTMQEYYSTIDPLDDASMRRAVYNQMARLTAENAHLRTLLARATCIQIVAHGEPYCPLCGFMVKVDGVFYHQDDCEGQAALKEGE